MAVVVAGVLRVALLPAGCGAAGHAPWLRRRFSLGRFPRQGWLQERECLLPHHSHGMVSAAFYVRLGRCCSSHALALCVLLCVLLLLFPTQVFKVWVASKEALEAVSVMNVHALSNNEAVMEQEVLLVLGLCVVARGAGG